MREWWSRSVGGKVRGEKGGGGGKWESPKIDYQ